jgi:hypothetical protein
MTSGGSDSPSNASDEPVEGDNDEAVQVNAHDWENLLTDLAGSLIEEDFFDAAAAGEVLEQVDVGPELQWLVGHMRNAMRNHERAGEVNDADLASIVMLRLVPDLRRDGTPGATVEELIGRFNTRFRVARNHRATKDHREASRVKRDPNAWKIKNRPKGLKYKKRAKKTKATKVKDVRIAHRRTSMHSMACFLPLFFPHVTGLYYERSPS